MSKTADQAFKNAVAAVCLYEAAAILAGRTPTISAMCDTRRWLAVIIIAGLAFHLG